MAKKSSKDTKKKKEITRDIRIKNEVKRLTELYENISEIDKQLIGNLIKRASFLLIISEDMETKIMGIGDFTKETVNASQKFEKANPVFKEYRETIKSYQAIIKQLSDVAHKKINESEESEDALQKFIKQGKK